MLPAIVMMKGEINLHKRAPLRPLGFADQVHAGFLRSPVGFDRITLDTGADNVLPGGRAASVPGDYMVQVQVLPVARGPAILAGILVPLEDVMSCKLYFLLRQAIVHQQ